MSQQYRNTWSSCDFCLLNDCLFCTLCHYLPTASVHFSSVAHSCLTLCDPMKRSTPGLPVHHHLPEFTQTHVHRVSDAIQPSHPLPSPSPPALNPSQHQSLFQWVNSSHEVAKVLEFQHHFFQRNPRADLLQNGLVGSPYRPRDSQESSPTPQFKSINLPAICKASSDNHAVLHFFLGGWFWSLPPIQCHEPPSIVHQALCLSDLIPWIYLSLPLYNHKGFDLGHTWMI